MLNFDWLSGISLSAAKGVIIGLFVLIGVLVFLLKNDYIVRGVERPTWRHNLKLWAIGVLGIIALTYLAF